LRFEVNDPKCPIEADLIDAVCDPTPASLRAIRTVASLRRWLRFESAGDGGGLE
jgi:hypothetical protein